MQNNGLFDETNYIHRLVFWETKFTFCPTSLIYIQRLSSVLFYASDSDAIAKEWNTHSIRAVKNSLNPAGIPNELYFLPEVQGLVL